MRQAPKENRNHNGDEHSNGHVCDNYLPLGPVLNKHLASITTAVPSLLALEPVPQFLPPPTISCSLWGPPCLRRAS